MRSCTVAAFNVHWGRSPRTNEPFDLVETCRTLDADVLALEEVWRPDGETSVAHEVAIALGYELFETWTCRTVVEPKCRVVGGAGSPLGDGDCGVALLTRLPRLDVSAHHLGGFFFDQADRMIVRAVVDLDGGPLTVCASHFPHLEHFSPLLRWRLRRVLPALDRPAVLMGDFNMWRWVARFVVPGWHDPVRGATWPAPKPVFQIDHLLATPPVVATDAEVVPVGASDHFPIRARISIP